MAPEAGAETGGEHLEVESDVGFPHACVSVLLYLGAAVCSSTAIRHLNAGGLADWRAWG